VSRNANFYGLIWTVVLNPEMRFYPAPDHHSDRRKPWNDQFSLRPLLTDLLTEVLMARAKTSPIPWAEASCYDMDWAPASSRVVACR
jgi:hypothetical protein